jgi:hypothetical protein
VGGGWLPHLPSLKGLFTVCVGKRPSSFLWSSGHPAVFAMFLFLVTCLLFRFFFFFFCRVGARLSRGLCCFIPGVAVGVPCASCLLTCWSESPKQVRSQCLASQKPSCFLCISWHGETMCRLGVWSCQSFASSWCFFLPGVSPVSLQDFYFKEHTLASSSL